MASSRLWMAAALPRQPSIGNSGPQGDTSMGVAPQVAGQGALDEAGVGAFAVDEEELATVPGAPEGLAFDVGGLAGT